MTEQLRQPYPITDWQQWPTLYSFCQSLSSVASRRGYNFYVGEKRFGMKDQKNEIAPVLRYCHPGPSLSTLDEKKAEPVLQTGPHLANVLLLIQMLQSLDGVPCFQNDKVLKFWGIMHYDGMPLNIGTFPRIEGREVIFDGIKPHLPLHQMKELQQNGSGALKKYISEHCSWISEVREYDITDASGSFFINAFTEYGTAQGTSDTIKTTLSNVVKSITVCVNCVKDGEHKDCHFTSLTDPCSRCKTLQQMGQNICCTSFKIIHVSSDQASAQRKAHVELNEVSTKDIRDSNYVQYGFGMLHFCKNAISAVRNYRLTDMADTFSVSMLTSIWASNSEESKRMKKVTPAGVFSFKDRHSDELCYQTVSKDLEQILQDTKDVLVTLVPEQYRTFAAEAKTHSLLGRPLYIATNANGDFLFTDAEFEVVVMANRHIPPKCIAIGKWDEPGPAHSNPMPSSKASFRHPAGIDVMICSPSKKEICFVADSGNHAIRYIDGVQNIEGPKLVGTLVIHPVAANWKPEGLAVLSTQTLAVTAGDSLFLIKLNEALLHGQMITIVSTLSSPHGLCPNPVNTDTVLVADRNVVKEINTTSKETVIIARGFQTAFDVSSAANKQIGITDVSSHKVTMLQWNDDLKEWTETKVVGSGTAGPRDGKASNAELHEPTGITFDLNSAIICCIGGKNHGCIKLYSELAFATTFMAAIRNIYDATGFLPKKEQNKSRKTDPTTKSPFISGTHKLIDSLSFLEGIMARRKAYLHKNGLDGTDGSMYSKTLEGFAQTVASLENHIRAMDDLEMDTTNVDLYAFVNESRKEHNFAKHKQSGQYRHPTMQQYSRTKGGDEEEVIKKTCRCPHSYHTNQFQAYQASHKSELSSVTVIKEFKKIKDDLQPEQVNLTQTEREKVKEDLKMARALNTLTKAMPSQNARDVYRSKCGFAPCIVDQLDSTLFQSSDANLRYYPSFHQLMSELSTSDNVPTTTGLNEDYHLIPGDIVAVNPGTEDGIPSGDKWWLLQVSRGLPTSKTSNGCHVSGFWLEMLPSPQQPDHGCALRLQRGNVTIYYGSLIKTCGKLTVIPVEELNTGWENGSVVYKLTNDYVRHLDKVSDDFRMTVSVPDLSSTCEENEHEEVDEATERELVHLHEVQELQSTRRRIIRDTNGQQITSYAQLNGHRQNVSRRTRRTHLLQLDNDNIASAQKNSSTSNIEP